MTDDKPTDPTPPADPAPTPPADPPAAPPPAADPKPEPRDDNAILAAIGELKDVVTGAVQVITTSAQPDATPAKKPWFARGGRS